MSWRTHASSPALIGLLLYVCVCVCGCGGGGASARRGGRPARAAVARAAAPAGVPAGERARFALLRTRPEGLPASARETWQPPVAGMSPALAQRIPVILPGAYWLVPGRGYLCVVTEIPSTPGVGSVCAKASEVLAHGLASIAISRTNRGSRRLVVGVAPDGARTVLVHTRGSVAAAPVVDGVFVLRDTDPVPSDFMTLR